MKYYLYRLKEEEFEKLENLSKIKYDFIPPECANCSEGDKIVIYISHSLTILGIYEKEAELFSLIQKTTDEQSLKEFYDRLSFVKEITPTTSKLFKKKMREIIEKDFSLISENI